MTAQLQQDQTPDPPPLTVVDQVMAALNVTLCLYWMYLRGYVLARDPRTVLDVSLAKGNFSVWLLLGVGILFMGFGAQYCFRKVTVLATAFLVWAIMSDGG